MMRIFFLSSILSYSVAVLGFPNHKVRRFQDGFLFGTSTAAYQVEGAWNEDGKGESFWDYRFHVLINQTHPPGDVACNSYHYYKRDVEMLRELGVDVYRFSISWPRILPGGFRTIKNEAGLQYYDDLIDELLKHNIQPMVTIYHFDTPMALQHLGGGRTPLLWIGLWTMPGYCLTDMLVKYWTTLNQPDTTCEINNKANYVLKNATGATDYLCTKHVLLAHARTYRMYEKKYKKKYGGSVGMSTAVNWVEPFTNSSEDVEAAERYKEFTYGIFFDPIWSKSGDFPKLVKDRVAKKSKEQGLVRSRLPSLSKEEIKLIKGSSDFLGLNHYTTYLITPSEIKHKVPSFIDDANFNKKRTRDEWTKSHSSWLSMTPEGLYKVCLLLNKRYDYPPILITENGWSTDTGLQDPSRSKYIQHYLNSLLLAIEEGTKVIGYIHWSLMDNVQWMEGTSERFGLYEVDFDSPERTRTARESSLVYKRIIQKRIIEEGWKPEK